MKSEDKKINLELYKSYLKRSKKDSNNPDIYSGLGLFAASIGKLDVAKNAFMVAVKLKPREADYIGLGNVLMDLKDINTAVGAYEKALKINPGSGEAYAGIGNANLAKLNYKKAINFFHKATRLSNSEQKFERAIIYTNMGYAYQKIKKFKKGSEYYLKAIKANPKCSLAHTNLGADYLDLDKYEMAVKHSRIALRLDPEDIRARHNLALAYLYMGKRKAFYRHYKILKENAPDMAEKCRQKISKIDIYKRLKI